MFEGKYRIGGRVLVIRSMYELIQRMCSDYRSDEPEDFSVTISPEMIEAERLKSKEQHEREGLPAYDYPSDYLETLAVYRELSSRLIAYDTLLFHGSVVAVDGFAYLFTAKSGVGKSTHVSLWRRLLGERALMVNDDKPLIRLTDGLPVVYGTPWDGKHHLSANVEVPLRAICLLERSEENRIERIAPSSACSFLLHQSFHPSDKGLLLSSLSLVNRLSGNVALYRLWCNMDISAAELSFSTMSSVQD